MPRVERESLKRNPDRFRRNFAALEAMFAANGARDATNS
jgi:hypothetical protein